jgi:hypothetical protein
LERRRKAFQLRAPLRALQQAQPVLESLFADPLRGRYETQFTRYGNKNPIALNFRS